MTRTKNTFLSISYNIRHSINSLLATYIDDEII